MSSPKTVQVLTTPRAKDALWGPGMKLIAALLGFMSIFAVAHGLTRLEESRQAAIPEPTICQETPALELEETPDPMVWHSGQFDANRAFIHQAADLGVGAAKVQELVSALEPFFDFRKARPRHQWRFGFLDGEFKAFTVRVSPEEIYDVDFLQGKFDVKQRDITVQTQTEIIRGEIRTCLFAAVAHLRKGERLAMKLADVFAWDIDFYLDPRTGDHFDVLVETRYVETEQGLDFLDYGSILTARYVSQRKTYDAFLFEDDEGDPAYFNSRGESLIRDVLRSPLRLTRVTSKFRHRRFHPVLKSSRPHNGVDYGAPRNTPVMSVADGKVVLAGRHGSAGIAVEIAHKGNMLTQYFHLKKLAPGIRQGVRVKQGRTIGFVGKTGLATGYHLHFGMKVHGKFVDPLRQKYEPGDPIPPEKMNEFAKLVGTLTKQLEFDQAHEPLSVIPMDDETIHGR